MRRKCDNLFVVFAALLCGFSFELSESAQVAVTQAEKQVAPVTGSRDILGISVPDFIETETKDDNVVPATLATTVGTTPVSITEVPEKVVTVNSVPFVSLESTTPTTTSTTSPDVTSSTSTVAPVSSTDATAIASVSPTAASPAQVPEVKDLKLKAPDNIEDLLPKIAVKAQDATSTSTLAEQSTTTLLPLKQPGNENVVTEKLRDASSTTEAANAVEPETTTEGPVILRPKEKSTPGPVLIPAPTDASTVCPVCGHAVSLNGHFCQSCGTNLEHPLRHSVPFVSYSGFGRTGLPEPLTAQGIVSTKNPTDEEKYFFPQRNAEGPPAQPFEPSPTPLRTIPVRAYVDLNAINLEKMRQNFWRTEVYKQAIGLGPAYMQRGDPNAQFPVPAPHERYLQPVVQGNGAPQFIQVQGTVPQRQYQVSGPQPKWSFSLPNLSSWFKLGSSASNEQNGTPVKNVRTNVAPPPNSGPGPVRPAEGIEPRNPAPNQGSIASFFNCPLAKQGH